MERRRREAMGPGRCLVTGFVICAGVFLAGLGSRSGAWAEEPRGGTEAGPPPVGRPPYAGGYYVYPWSWYGIPTQPYKRVRPEVEPRLGHIYQTPYTSWQMGLQLPEDSEPLSTYSLGRFQGVVRSPQWPAWLRSGAPDDESDAATLGISLMREGEYRTAGKIQAEGFRRGEDPRFAFCLVESLCALEKYAHADLVLRYALAQDGAFEALSEDVASHFPDRDAFEARVRSLAALDQPLPLLRAYLLVYSSKPAQGLDALMELAKTDGPDRELAGRLYRHFIDRTFMDESPAAPATPPAEDAAPEKPSSGANTPPGAGGAGGEKTKASQR